MRKVAIFCLSLFITQFAIAHDAQKDISQLSSWLEPKLACNTGGCSTRLNAGVAVKFTEKIGAYGFAQNIAQSGAKPYQQAYGGLTFAPTSKFQFGLGVGRDSESAAIKNLLAVYNSGSLSFFGNIERGGTPYEKVVVMSRGSSLRFGAVHESTFGTGPIIDYRITRNVSGAMSVQVKNHLPTAVIAVNVSF